MDDEAKVHGVGHEGNQTAAPDAGGQTADGSPEAPPPVLDTVQASAGSEGEAPAMGVPKIHIST